MQNSKPRRLLSDHLGMERREMIIYFPSMIPLPLRQFVQHIIFPSRYVLGVRTGAILIPIGCLLVHKHKNPSYDYHTMALLYILTAAGGHEAGQRATCTTTWYAYSFLQTAKCV
eukprot:scaffold882_cov85-Skeletonema_marinoi.AAC.10